MVNRKSIDKLQKENGWFVRRLSSFVLLYFTVSYIFFARPPPPNIDGNRLILYMYNKMENIYLSNTSTIRLWKWCASKDVRCTAFLVISCPCCAVWVWNMCVEIIKYHVHPSGTDQPVHRVCHFSFSGTRIAISFPFFLSPALLIVWCWVHWYFYCFLHVV